MKFYTGRLQMPEGEQQGATGGPHLAQARPSLAGRAWPRCGPPRMPPTPTLRLFIHPRRENPKYSEKKSRKKSVAATTVAEKSEALPGTLPEGRSSPEAFFITM